MPVINDKYALSTTDELTVNRDELNENLVLSPYEEVLRGIVAGVVFAANDLIGARVSNATVKIFDLNGLPLFHTQTNVNGEYSIINIPFGEYKISAVKEGFYLANNINITVSSVLPMTQNIVLTTDPNELLNVVYGKVLDESGNPISDVRVSLFNSVCISDTATAITFSNELGDYVLEDIPSGTYRLVFEQVGYTTIELSNITLSCGARLLQNITLSEEVTSDFGTISGLITNEENIPVANAYVGLYRVIDSSLELVQVTYTNSDGRYMFGGVEEGNYVIKSKESVTV